MLTTGRTRIDERTVRIQCLFVLLGVVFFHHFCSCKSIAVWGSGSHSSVMVHLFHGSCYGKTERRRGGRGGYVGSPAWLFSLSLTFPMWLCICVFDHVNPCLAPTPPSLPAIDSLPHTPQCLTEIDSPLYPTHPLQNGMHSSFHHWAAYPIPK